MPILKALNYAKISAAAVGQPATTTHYLSPESRALILSLLIQSGRDFVWSPELTGDTLHQAKNLVQVAISQVTIPVE